MKRSKKLGRSALFLFLLGVGPLSLGCEALLDFDRSPLQPVVEASVRETSAPAPDGGRRDTGTEDDDDDDDDNGPADAGTDARDAGDSGDANQ